MLPLELLLPFLIATAVFAFTPGPGMLYMAVQTMAHGVRAGWLSSLAFHLASYLHIAAAAFGVTVLLAAAPVLLVVLKVVGGAYLVWMGLRLWRRPSTPSSFEPEQGRDRPADCAFRDSFLVEVLNPKSALFYFAFLPQFTVVDAALPIYAQIVVLGVIANIAFSLADVPCILFARAVAVHAKASERITLLGRRIGGTILICMGTKVVVDVR